MFLCMIVIVLFYIKCNNFHLCWEVLSGSTGLRLTQHHVQKKSFYFQTQMIWTVQTLKQDWLKTALETLIYTKQNKWSNPNKSRIIPEQLNPDCYFYFAFSLIFTVINGFVFSDVRGDVMNYFRWHLLWLTQSIYLSPQRMLPLLF